MFKNLFMMKLSSLLMMVVIHYSIPSTTSFMTPPTSQSRSITSITQTTSITTTKLSSSTTNTDHESILNDIDMMCITNAFNLCNDYYYDECDIEQREAFINLLDDQLDVLVDRLVKVSTVRNGMGGANGSGNGSGNGEGGVSEEIADVLKSKIEAIVKVDASKNVEP